MYYKWKPSKSARREFAQKMQNDTEFAENYNEKKKLKKEKNRADSSFDYSSAGGKYVPTSSQFFFCINNINLFKSFKEKEAADIVIFGYSCNEKIHHDFIHVVNEKMRKF